MTTIACDGKQIAGDGLVSGGNVIHSRTFAKVHALTNGVAVGFSGGTYLVQDAIAYLLGEKDALDLGEDFEAIILHPCGKCECMDGKGRRYNQPAPCATGSGAVFALAAMAAGKDAIQAVRIACDLDPFSGGDVTSARPLLGGTDG